MTGSRITALWHLYLVTGVLTNLIWQYAPGIGSGSQVTASADATTSRRQCNFLLAFATENAAREWARSDGSGRSSARG